MTRAAPPADDEAGWRVSLVAALVEGRRPR
jgi:hypothetical protein